MKRFLLIESRDPFDAVGEPIRVSGARVLAALALVSMTSFTAGCVPDRVAEPSGDTGNAPSHSRLYADGDRDSRFTALALMQAGGYVAAGDSADLDNGLQDLWAVKTNPDGSVAWQQRIGPNPANTRPATDAWANDLQLTRDGGCVIAGQINGRATVVKLRLDGSIEWQWSFVPDESGFFFPPPADQPQGTAARAEATAIAVKRDGSGYYVVGMALRTDISPAGFPWQVELTVAGVPPTRAPFVQGFWGSSDGTFFLDRDHLSTGRANVVLDLGADSAGAGRFLMAGSQDTDSTLDVGDHHKWLLLARAGARAEERVSVEAARYFGPGEIRSVLALPNGHFLAAGADSRACTDAPGVCQDGRIAGLFLCELDQSLHVVWARRYRRGGRTDLPLRVNAVRPSGDGGYMVAAQDGLSAEVLKVSADGSVQWAAEYVNESGLTDGTAFDVQQGSDGNYVMAGGISDARFDASRQLFQSPLYDRSAAAVLTLGADGSLATNPLARVERRNANFVPEDMTGSLDAENASGIGYTSSTIFNVLVTEHSGEDVQVAGTQAPLVVSTATNATIETLSGSAGALPTPRTGTNEPVRHSSFYWFNVDDASGFIVYFSLNGTDGYHRLYRTANFGFDFDGGHGRDSERNAGFYRVAAFNASGYSDLTEAVRIGEESSTRPATARLTVMTGANPDFGLVTSTPTGISCGTICSAGFPADSSVELFAADGELGYFSSWQGCDSAASRTCRVTMRSDRTVTAIFVATPN